MSSEFIGIIVATIVLAGAMVSGQRTMRSEISDIRMGSGTCGSGWSDWRGSSENLPRPLRDSETESTRAAMTSKLPKDPDSGKMDFSSPQETSEGLNMNWIFRVVLLLLLGAGGWYLNSIDHRIQKMDERLRNVEVDMGHIKGSRGIRYGAGWSRFAFVTILEK